jgi:hypothetical protein
MADSHTLAAITKLLTELLDGAPAKDSWMLNPEDPGLLRSLEKLSAKSASAVPPNGGASIAAHVDHLRYGFELLNRWNQSEEPFADADYSASWTRGTVTEQEWATRLEALRRESYAWREALQRPRELSEFAITAIVSSVAHLAYHLGAIRQIDRSTRGPSASG